MSDKQEAFGEVNREVAVTGGQPRSEPSPLSSDQTSVLQAQVIEETRSLRRLLSRQMTLIRHRIHIGPLPPAGDFKAYEAVQVGSADRILKMAESELAHGQQMDRDVLAADKEIAGRGQHYALISTTFLGVLGAILGFTGHDWLGGAFVVSALVPIVAHFLTSRSPEPKLRSKPQAGSPDPQRTKN